MTPTDPQGAEGRETRTEWRNVYEDGVIGFPAYDTRKQADDAANLTQMIDRVKRVAVEEIHWTITQVTRHPLGGTERE